MINTFNRIKRMFVSLPEAFRVAKERWVAYARSLRIEVAFQLWKLKDDAMTTFNKLRDEAGKVWQSFKDDVLQPLREMANGLLEDWNEMTAGMLEGFQALWEDIQEPAKELKQFMVNKVFAPIEGAVNGIKGAVDGVKRALGELARKARNLGLPAWMIPGSPPPLEVGLRGIADAARAVNAEFGNMQISGDVSFAGAGGPQTAGPLVQIDKVIVPNRQVGRAFAKDMAEELGALTRTRRTRA
jgi:hypothetical protein